MTRTPATVTLELATGELTGLFTFDESLFDGDDVLAGEFGGNVFFDLTGRDQLVSISRGMKPDLGGINQGTAETTLTDEDGDFNPENPTSPIADDLDVMLPLRIRGTHPSLFENYRDTVLADEPAAYYRLDEASGTLCRDSSGNELDGTYTGGVTLGQAGALSGDADTAALMNGTSGDMRSLTVPTPAGAFSVEFWLKPSALSNYNQGIGAVNHWGAFLFHSEAGGGAFVGTDVATRFGPGETGVVLAVGQWSHIVYTYDGANGRLYRDGALTAGPKAQTAPGAWGGFTTCHTGIGTAIEGTLDEVAIHPTALSAARILAHYEAGTGTGGDARTAGLFYGFLRDYEHDPDLNVRKSYLSAVDFFEWLGEAGVKPVIAATGPISEGEAIGLILDAAQWTDPTLRDLDEGGTLADFSADGTQTGLALIQGIVTVTLGLFFVRGDGVVRYISRETRFSPQASIATLNGSLITGAKPRKSVDQVRNRITVTRSGGTPQDAVDEESRRKYGYRDHSIESAYFVADSDALSLANLYVLLYGRPRAPIRQVELVNRDDESILLQLTLEIGDRVTVSEASGGTDAEGEIVGIQHRWMPGGEWRTRYLISTIASTLQFFTFDDDTGASVFDGTAVLAY